MNWVKRKERTLYRAAVVISGSSCAILTRWWLTETMQESALA